jgi:hypothetical protein
MIDRPIFTKVIVIFLLCFVFCQNKSNAQQVVSDYFHDDVLGIAFAKIGTVVKVDNSTYHILLQSSENSPVHPAVVQVSTTDRLFVDLPGSYGGRLFFDSPSASQLFQNRIFADSVNTGQLNFRREYWVVYAGMGMWEGVINCYTQKGGEYYVVSLIQNLSVGKPGEEVDGKPLTFENLKGKVFQSLHDTTDVIVNEFTTLLTSFQVQNKD